MRRRLVLCALFIAATVPAKPMAGPAPKITVPPPTDIKSIQGPEGAASGLEKDTYSVFGLVVPIHVNNQTLKGERPKPGNPPLPRICGQMKAGEGKRQVWVSDLGPSEGRETASVRFWMKGDKGVSQVEGKAVRPPTAVKPPTDCENARLWEANTTAEVAGITANDLENYGAAILPVSSQWPPRELAEIVEDDDEPEAYLDKNIDLTSVSGAIDKDWLMIRWRWKAWWWKAPDRPSWQTSMASRSLTLRKATALTLTARKDLPVFIFLSTAF